MLDEKEPPMPEPRRANTRRIGLAALAGTVLTLALIGGLWAFGPRLAAISALMPGNEPPGPMSAERADVTARRAAAAAGDVQRFWAERLRSETALAFSPATLRHFIAETPSPCAGADNAAGPFYCRATRTLAFDLSFLEQLSRWLRVEGEQATALFVARVVAVHVQGELGLLASRDRAGRNATARETRALDRGLALHADCLTGLWAREAERRIGPVTPEFYGRVINSARNVAANGQRLGTRLPDAALIAAGSRAERTQAFATGLDATAIADCPLPAWVVAGG
jgi:predicted metalloprotease